METKRIISKTGTILADQHKREKLRMLILGQHLSDGLFFRIGSYIILTSIVVLYLSPLFYMISTSFKNLQDLLDPNVKWIPTVFNIENYKTAILGLTYYKALGHTFFMSISAAFLQIISCGITGYAFARLYIPGKNILFAIVLLTFMVPAQTMIVPLYVLYSKLGWLNTPLPFIIPAVFAQGLKGALFIIIFRQFFATLPKELEESARMDGAGAVKIYWKIMLPLARPAVLVVFLFSFVWHWNNYFEPSLYLQKLDFIPLALQLDRLGSILNAIYGTWNPSMGLYGIDLNEPIKMAAAVMIILPPLIVYMFAQRYFVEGIERTGLVE
jgi:multiple sugar transport system permease protein